MKPVHNANCANVMLVADLLTEQYQDSHITSRQLQRIINRIKPCGACSAALFREQSHLSGRIYRTQVEKLLKQYSQEVEG
jgi:hypothetical protein